jgi:hypothetical protein
MRLDGFIWKNELGRRIAKPDGTMRTAVLFANCAGVVTGQFQISRDSSAKAERESKHSAYRLAAVFLTRTLPP